MLKPLDLNEDAFVRCPRLQRLKKYLEENYHRPISLGRAAQQVGLERTYFSRFFRKKTGVRFWHWISHVRIRRAVEILQSSDISISRLAETVGFEDIRTFERTFKKITGLTPSRYRATALARLTKDSAETRRPAKQTPRQGAQEGQSMKRRPVGSQPHEKQRSTGGCKVHNLLQVGTGSQDYLANGSPADPGLEEHELRRALECGELRVHYQPIVSLQSGRTAGLEALVRWHHPNRGLLLPRDFLGLAVRSDLLSRIDRWVMGEACRQLARWRDKRSSSSKLTVSVNVEADDLAAPEFSEQIERILNATGLSPSDMKLEITENTVFQRSPSTLATIAELRDRGIGFHIDDFGTGYSSLSSLLLVPTQALKVDRTFVAGMLCNRVHDEIVRTVVTLAHNLKIDVIAEGVESEGQFEYLKELGCRYAQGHLFSKPVRGDGVPLSFDGLGASWEESAEGSVA